MDESAKWLRENGWLKAGDVLLQRGESVADKDYLDAVNRGDMETAQRMVDEAARAAGYAVKAYHGTPKGGFTEFKPGGSFGPLFFFAKEKKYADYYANRFREAPSPTTYEVFLKMENAEQLDAVGDQEDKMLAYRTRKRGFDSIETPNAYVVFLPDQIKSADPVTRDKRGNIIPLSQRFNPESPSILYQTPELPDAALHHIATLAAAKMAQNGSFSRDSLHDYLSKQFNDVVARHTDTIWTAAKSIYNSAASGEPTVEDVVSEAVTPDGKTIRDTARAVIASGVVGKDVMPAVHEALSEKFPDLDYEKMIEEFTGYGKVLKPLTRPDIEKQISLITGIERQLKKQREIAAGRNPKRSNIRPQAERNADLMMEERTTAQMLRKARLEGKLPVEDLGTDTKSLLESAKTRIRNATDLMRFAREIGKPIEKAQNVRTETDEVLQQLQKEHAEEKARYDEMFNRPATDEEKAALIGKALDTAIAEEETALRDGLAKGPGEPREADTDANLRKRRRLAELRAARRDLWEVQHPEDSALRYAQRQADAKLNAYRKALSGETTEAARPGVPFAPSEELWATWTAIDALKDEVEELKKSRRESPESQQREIDRAVKANEKTIATLEDKLAKDDLTYAAKKEPSAAQKSEIVQRQKAVIKELNAELTRRRRVAEVGPYSPEAKLDRRIHVLETRLKELERRLREKDYSKAVKDVTPDTPRERELQYKLALLKDQINQDRIATLKANEPKVDKALRFGRNLIMAHKLLKLGGDVGAIFRQLGTATAKATVEDIQALLSGKIKEDGSKLGRYLKVGLEAFKDAESEHRIYTDLKARDMAKYDRLTKLRLVAPFDENIDNDIPRENLIEKFPWWAWPALGAAKIALFGASPPAAIATLAVGALTKQGLVRLDRAQRVLTNVMRADMADSMISAASEGGSLSAKELRKVGKLVNMATGYGEIQSINAALPVAQYVLNAPRFYISRVQMLLGYAGQLTGASRAVEPNKYVRNEISKMYAKDVAGRAVYYAILAMIAGASYDDKDKKKKGIVLNPFSTDFGKVRLSDGVAVDFTSGMNSFATVTARLLGQRMTVTDPRTGKEKTIPLGVGYGHSAGDVLTNFLSSKNNMTTALLWNTMINRQYFGGKPADWKNFLDEATTMIMLNDIQRIYDELGPVRGSAVVALMWGGMGIATAPTEADKAANKAAMKEYHRMLEEKEREMNQ